jgi:hypothetical protein
MGTKAGQPVYRVANAAGSRQGRPGYCAYPVPRGQLPLTRVLCTHSTQASPTAMQGMIGSNMKLLPLERARNGCTTDVENVESCVVDRP